MTACYCCGAQASRLVRGRVGVKVVDSSLALGLGVGLELVRFDALLGSLLSLERACLASVCPTHTRTVPLWLYQRRPSSPLHVDPNPNPKPNPNPNTKNPSSNPTTITLTLPGAHEYGSVLSYKVGTAAAASRHHGRLDNSPLAPSASATHLARARPLCLCRCAARESTAPRPTSGRCRARGGSGGWRRWWWRGHRARRSRRRRGGRPVHAAAGLSAGGAGTARGFPHHTPGVRVVRR